jgi:soluble lytic murein transglycosylase
LCGTHRIADKSTVDIVLDARRCLRLATLACAVALAVAAHAQNPADADVLAAKAAYERGDAAALARIAPRTAAHALAPYVALWQLELALDTVDADRVHEFLRRHAGTPLADRLAVDWLKSRARRGDWVAFASEFPPRTTPDAELACDAVQYHRQRDGEAALAEAKPLWFNGQSLPDACEALFADLAARNMLSPDDRIARLRLATEGGNWKLAHALAETLPGEARVKPQELAALDRDPGHALARGQFAWKRASGQVLVLYALERAGRSDAADAHASWIKWRDRLPDEARGYGNARIAYLGARKLEPQAYLWYRQADVTRENPDERAWHVRAALRAGDWRDVLAAIDALPLDVAADPAWRYWRARALASLGREAEAKPIYAVLAGEYGFYPLLAAEALGRRPQLASKPAPPSDAWLVDFGARADVARVVKLAELDMRGESQREWAAVVREMDDETLLKAAEFARRAGLYDRAINTAERTAERHDFALRYPTPYAAEFVAAATSVGIDAPLLFGVARQESRFVADIVSSAGAMGLMQLMPPTARWVSKQLNRTDYRGDAITDVDLNAEFGAFYLKYWLDRLDGLPALAAAAYNAGPRRADAWRPPVALEGAIWVETIPFNETRDYVKKVLANATYYASLLGKPGARYVSLTDRLGTIGPRATTAALAPGAQ